MPKYAIDVVVTDSAPRYGVDVNIGHNHITTARNANKDWEGKLPADTLDFPVDVDCSGSGIGLKKWTVNVTLTPDDGSAPIAFKQSDHLDKFGYGGIKGSIPLPPATAPANPPANGGAQ